MENRLYISKIRKAGSARNGEYATIQIESESNEEIALWLPFGKITDFLLAFLNAAGLAEQVRQGKKPKVGEATFGYSLATIEIDLALAADKSEALLRFRTPEQMTIGFRMSHELLTKLCRELPGLLHEMETPGPPKEIH